MKHKSLLVTVPIIVLLLSAATSPSEALAWPPAPPPPAPCPANPGGQPYTYVFCLLAPGGNPNRCYDRFESWVSACDYWTAVNIAWSGASNYSIYDGYCPACY